MGPGKTRIPGSIPRLIELGIYVKEMVVEKISQRIKETGEKEGKGIEIEQKIDKGDSKRNTAKL